MNNNALSQDNGTLNKFDAQVVINGGDKSGANSRRQQLKPHHHIAMGKNNSVVITSPIIGSLGVDTP
jgi:hypothetical protein